MTKIRVPVDDGDSWGCGLVILILVLLSLWRWGAGIDRDIKQLQADVQVLQQQKEGNE